MTNFTKTIERPAGAERCDWPECENRAVCDAPTTLGTAWGYLCAEHFARHGVAGFGFRFADSTEQVSA